MTQIHGVSSTTELASGVGIGWSIPTDEDGRPTGPGQTPYYLGCNAESASMGPGWVNAIGVGIDPAGKSPLVRQMYYPGDGAASATTTTMSKEEIGLRLQNLALADQLATLTAKLAAVEAATRYGEQGDDAALVSAFTAENAPAKTFPAQALRHQHQRIGLFVPR